MARLYRALSSRNAPEDNMLAAQIAAMAKERSGRTSTADLRPNEIPPMQPEPEAKVYSGLKPNEATLEANAASAAKSRLEQQTSERAQRESVTQGMVDRMLGEGQRSRLESNGPMPTDSVGQEMWLRDRRQAPIKNEEQAFDREIAKTLQEFAGKANIAGIEADGTVDAYTAAGGGTPAPRARSLMPPDVRGMQPGPGAQGGVGPAAPMPPAPGAMAPAGAAQPPGAGAPRVATELVIKDGVQAIRSALISGADPAAPLRAAAGLKAKLRQQGYTEQEATEAVKKGMRDAGVVRGQFTGPGADMIGQSGLFGNFFGR